MIATKVTIGLATPTGMSAPYAYLAPALALGYDREEGLQLAFCYGGEPGACLLQAPFAPLRWLILSYIEVLRDIPLVVALFWIHFALPVATGISTTAFESGFIAMALQSSAYLADVARAGIAAVPRGQWDAADSLGLSRQWKWLDVVLPQAFKIMVPPLANVALGYFKASSVLALLSVGELMTVALRISNYTFKPIETLTTVGAIYLVLGYVLSSLTYRLEWLFKTAA